MFDHIDPELHRTLGYYLPNRFTINMGDYQLPIEEKETEKFNLFLHEYIHLIQNIFTVSGWYSFAYESSQYEAVAKLILGKSEIVYPVRLYMDKDFTSDSLDILTKRVKYQQVLFDKDNIGPRSVVEFFGPQFMEISVPSGTANAPFNRPTISTAFNVNGNIEHIKIGYFVIVESMAYIVERYYNIHNESTPDYPYKILTKIFDASPLKGLLPIQITIAYLALMHPFPDMKFKELFECVIKEKLYLCSKLEDVTKALLEVHFPHTIDAITKHFEVLSEHIQEFIRVISTHEMSDRYVFWLESVTSSVFKNISTNPVHYINPILRRGGADEILAMLNLNYFLFDNSDGELSLPKREIDGDASAVIFNRNFFHLMDLILIAKTRKCPMHQNCSLPEKDANCEFEPFKHAYRDVGEEICDYGQVAQLFGAHQFPSSNLL